MRRSRSVTVAGATFGLEARQHRRSRAARRGVPWCPLTITCAARMLLLVDRSLRAYVCSAAGREVAGSCLYAA
jgi:hypothetical protein